MINSNCRGCDGSGWTIVAGVRKPCPVHSRQRVTDTTTPPRVAGSSASPAAPSKFDPPPPDGPVFSDWDSALENLCVSCGTILNGTTACYRCGKNQSYSSSGGSSSPASPRLPAYPAAPTQNTPAREESPKPKIKERVRDWHQTVAAPAVQHATPKIMRSLTRSGETVAAALLWTLRLMFRMVRNVFRKHPIAFAVVVVLGIVLLAKDTPFGDNVTTFAAFVLAFYFLGKALKHFSRRH